MMTFEIDEVSEQVLGLTPGEWRAAQVDGFLRVQSPSHPERTYLLPFAAGPVRVIEVEQTVPGQPVLELDVAPPVEAPPIRLLGALLIQRALIQRGGEDVLLRMGQPRASCEPRAGRGAITNKRLPGRVVWRILLRPGD